jgi:hypothetical protein
MVLALNSPVLTVNIQMELEARSHGLFKKKP